MGKQGLGMIADSKPDKQVITYYDKYCQTMKSAMTKYIFQSTLNENENHESMTMKSFVAGTAFRQLNNP